MVTSFAVCVELATPQPQRRPVVNKLPPPSPPRIVPHPPQFTAQHLVGIAPALASRVGPGVGELGDQDKGG